MSHIIDKSYFVVFNLTANDWLKVNETATNAQKDVEGIRYWVTKKTGEESYIFEGAGNYTDGPIINIGAIEMQPEELDILAHSPRFEAVDFAELKFSGSVFMQSETHFRDCVLQLLSTSLIGNDATPANIATANTALKTFTDAINVLDFDNAHAALIAIVPPQGSFTATIQTNILNVLEGYLKNYPR